ncbi:FIST C-terminal domain-containing protein [Chitinimonas lacunae]|uniref:FIST C-terminal domain-containing protein n=1 Tax=Chitinimonas lacunae TaxID=1963018 RepID=A0ABV8MVH9_9NEIS
MSVASGIASGAVATPRLAAEAVERALSRAGLDRAQAVLLFLSADFADDPRPALVAAARAAQTLALTGCTALGILTEEDWILDAPSAAALVLGGERGFVRPGADQAVLTLAAPNTLDLAWLAAGVPRYGGIAGDATGLGPYKVWQQGQLRPDGRCEQALSGPPPAIHVSRGMLPLGEPLRIDELDGFDLLRLSGQPAATTLRRVATTLALHELALAGLDEHGRIVHCWPLVGIDEGGAVTVAAHLRTGGRVVWMRRSAEAARVELETALQDGPASFGLLFSCGSRGAAFHGGIEGDWRAIRQARPGLPLVGFYGNGQIAPVGGENRLLHHSVVVSLFA